MRWSALVLGLAACGAGPNHRWTLDEIKPLLPAAHQAADVRALLDVPLGYGGLWFHDPECQAQFIAPGVIGADRIDAFARCLATLHLETSARRNPFPDIVVLSYAPGFEVEAQFVVRDDGARVHWIGYAGRHDVRDALPAITPDALEALRTAGARDPALDAAADAKLASERAQTKLAVSSAWLKVCIDRDGNVTGAHPRQVTSPIAADVFATAVRDWRFRPFVVDGQPLPVCAMVQLARPREQVPDDQRDVLPYPMPADIGALDVSPASLTRASGDPQVFPQGVEFGQFRQLAGVTFITAYAFCIDADGKVALIHKLRGTGVDSYDDRVGQRLLTWRYHPFVIDGKPIPVCSMVTFVYTQRG